MMTFDEASRSLAAFFEGTDPFHARTVFVRRSCERDGLPEWLIEAVLIGLRKEWREQRYPASTGLVTHWPPQRRRRHWYG